MLVLPSSERREPHVEEMLMALGIGRPQKWTLASRIVLFMMLFEMRKNVEFAASYFDTDPREIRKVLRRRYS